MTRLGFYLARSFRNEKALAQLSLPQDQFLAEFESKDVALVGNARALANGMQGRDIDAADVVVRINRAPMTSELSHGVRTDILALATRISAQDRQRIAPGQIIWMSPKRKRLDWQTATSPEFYLHPLADYEALKQRLSAPPTTGAMLIALLLRSGLRELNLYGFDFFASQSLSGRRSAADVPHDFRAEAKWVAALIAVDKRLTLQSRMS